MLNLLKKHFGYETFRPMQEDIINHCLAGRDALVLMPTGGGKSLCFQLPALKFPGITIVVSPLIALMKDQVDALRANGISAAFINSSLTPFEIENVENQAMQGGLKLLYLAPERLSMPRTMRFMQSLNLSLFAIDEAHCISEWGHDFRPDYRNLLSLRRHFPSVPMLALTATANIRVRDDIVGQLELKNSHIFQSSFNRANLNYRVVPKKRAFDKLLQEIKTRPEQSVIVYCFSRKGTEKTAADLRANGIKASAYHAGMTSLERTRVQDKFIRDQINVICATIAFGMGIDKPDVRLVAHMDMPKSVEGYYQETGRAGRDGLQSDCLMFYSNGDRFKHNYFIRQMEDSEEQQRARIQLDEIAHYCDLKTCRRAYLLNYFGEKFGNDNCGACDVCVPVVQTAPAYQSAKPTDLDFDRELFELLRDLRRALADEDHVPPYVVFGDRTLQEMCTYYPQKIESLKCIFGVGGRKLDKYGATFVDTIRKYTEPKNIPENLPAPANDSGTRRSIRAISDTVLESVRLFKENISLDKIATIRKIKPGTIIAHLEDAMGHGLELDISPLDDFNEEELNRIGNIFNLKGYDTLAPAYYALNESCSYDRLRLARMVLRSRKGGADKQAD